LGWWIIDARKLEKYGPFSKDEKDLRLSELGVAAPISVYPTPAASGLPVFFGDDELHRRSLK
jgi:hypothetical protein